MTSDGPHVLRLLVVDFKVLNAHHPRKWWSASARPFLNNSAFFLATRMKSPGLLNHYSLIFECRNFKSLSKASGEVRWLFCSVREVATGMLENFPLSCDRFFLSPLRPTHRNETLFAKLYKEKATSLDSVGMSFSSHLLRPLVFGLKNQQKDFCHSHSYSCIGLERAFLSFTLH